MSGMAEVLAAHRVDSSTSPDNTGRCVCGFSLDPMAISWDDHLAEALTAAGFGPVKEAAAKALEDAADDFTERVAVTRNMTRDNGTAYATATLNNAYGMEIAATALRARAATVRGEP